MASKNRPVGYEEASFATSRIDEAKGVQEEVTFFGPASGRLFGCLHTPLSPPSSGVVICCAVGRDFEKNYRREVLLARALASRGVAVQRFHYRGLGHSQGDTPAMTFEAMREDALAAEEELVTRTGVGITGFMGSWMGGLVAAAASSAPPRPTSLLALWEPTLDGTAYFKEQFRLSFLTDLKRGGLKPPSREALLDELKGQGWTDILGRTVGWPFYQSVVERTLIGEIGEHSPPLLLVCMSVEGPVVDTYRSYEEKLRAKGFPVEYRFVNTNEAWGPGKRRKGSVPLTRMTADWIADTLDTGRQR